MLTELIKEINRIRFREYLQGFTFGIRTSFRSSFGWPWIILHFLAILLTLPLILWGVDWTYFLFFKDHIYLQYILFPAVPLGGFLPFFGPPIIYLYAKKENKPELEPLAFALTQTAVVGTALISIYKAITGRLEPEIFEEVTNDRSRDFAWGFLQRGVFHGWPSTHTTVAWAFAIVIYFYRPEININENKGEENPSKIFKYRKLGFVYAFYVGLGVSSNIHWFSDAVAGVLIGITVGFAVVRTFETNWNKEEAVDIENSEIYKVFFIVLLLIIFSAIRL